MKRFVGLLGLGVLAAIVQGVAGTFLPQRFVPDLGFLLVVTLGLSWRSLGSGMGLAACLGYLTDLLSGSLLGQHVLLRMFVFSAARLGSRHLSLLGAVPRASFVAASTAVNAFAMELLSAAFTDGPAFAAPALTGLVAQMVLNALFSAPVGALTERAVALLGEDEGSRRLSLETSGGRLG